MIHYVCDMCGKNLLEDEDVRYVVKIDVYAAYDTLEIDEEDLKKDYMQEIHDLVEKMQDMDDKELEEQVYRRFRFDLCPKCQKKYLQDPLFKDKRNRLRFSDN